MYLKLWEYFSQSILFYFGIAEISYPSHFHQVNKILLSPVYV